ncbi:MAG: autotransporter outer membrane beta-barrel domain-containing protein, partial [Rickettsia endosymbiont of Pseudomimeciton antennatum]|nr:autotransporter outer membrane beta-barrel domain-containing protein [Rickettsia endosymbiont of Pseudomimeciton antennatum]
PPPPRGGGVPPEGDGVVPPPPPPRGGGVPPERDGGVPPPPPPREGGVPPEGDGVVPPPLPPRGGGVPPEGDGVVPPPPPPRGGGVPPEGDGVVPPPPPPGGGDGRTTPPPPINFDIENNIVRHITPIEFDYLNLISNALSIRNNILQHNFDNVVEAGDNNYYIGKRGWIQFVRSITKQKGSILAFKNSQQGFILGFDVQPLDKFIVGIAYATASSFTKFQSIFNDQQNTTLHVGAIYSKYALLPNIYLNSYLKYGKAFIQNLGRRERAAVHSKTKGDITRAKLETYYELKLDKFLFKPIVGVVFDHFLIKNFTEYRKEFNINIPTRKGKRILLETGIGLSKAILVKNISIIPEVHLKLDNTLLLKNSIDIISVTGTAHHIQKIAPISQSVGFFPKNIMYTLGGYVNMQSVLALELAAGYDYSFRKNFTTHSFYINGIVKF